MEKNKNKNQINSTLIIVVVVAILLMGVIFLLLNRKGTGAVHAVSNNKVAEEVKTTLDQKDKMIVFVGSTDKKDCSNCADIEKYLNGEGIKYTYFDVAKASKDDYNNFLDLFKVNKDDFKYPAVIYVNEGIMYSNIIAINSNDLVKQFIEEYKLKEVK